MKNLIENESSLLRLPSKKNGCKGSFFTKQQNAKKWIFNCHGVDYVCHCPAMPNFNLTDYFSCRSQTKSNLNLLYVFYINRLAK